MLEKTVKNNVNLHAVVQ